MKGLNTLFFFLLFGEERWTEGRRKRNERVAAVGEGFDKKLRVRVVILGGVWWQGTRQTLASEEAF